LFSTELQATSGSDFLRSLQEISMQLFFMALSNKFYKTPGISVSLQRVGSWLTGHLCKSTAARSAGTALFRKQ
jgi:hypothetical protein